jgi:hypothetical protein
LPLCASLLIISNFSGNIEVAYFLLPTVPYLFISSYFEAIIVTQQVQNCTENPVTGSGCAPAVMDGGNSSWE